MGRYNKQKQALIKAQENFNTDDTEKYYQQFVALSQLKIDISKKLGQRTILNN